MSTESTTTDITDALNYLIYCDLKDRMFESTADIFKNECNLQMSKFLKGVKAESPPKNALASLVDDAIRLNNWRLHHLISSPKSEKPNTDDADSTNETSSDSVQDLYTHPCYFQTTLNDLVGDCKGYKNKLLENTRFCTAFHNDKLLTKKTKIFVDGSILESNHKGAILSCQWDPSGSPRFAVSSADSNSSVWFLDPHLYTSSSFKRIHLMLSRHYSKTPPKCKEITSLQWHPNNMDELLTTNANESTVIIWSIAKSGTQINSLSSALCGIVTVAKYCPNGLYIATGWLDGTCAVWNLNTNKLFQSSQMHSGIVFDVIWLNSRMYASCSSDGKIIVWSLSSQLPVHLFVGHSASVICMDLSCVFMDKSDPDLEEDPYDDYYMNQCGWLASGSSDGTIRVWKVPHKLSIHKHSIFPRNSSFCSIVWLQWAMRTIRFGVVLVLL